MPRQDPDERFQSVRDLALAMESSGDVRGGAAPIGGATGGTHGDVRRGPAPARPGGRSRAAVVQRRPRRGVDQCADTPVRLEGGIPHIVIPLPRAGDRCDGRSAAISGLRRSSKGVCAERARDSACRCN